MIKGTAYPSAVALCLGGRDAQSPGKQVRPIAKGSLSMIGNLLRLARKACNHHIINLEATSLINGGILM